jgi:3-hydroxybutyryl-CoA dehydratase
MIRGYFEQNKPGDKTVTRARTVTEPDIIAFAGLSGDWHPLHTDAEYASKGPFKQRIGHGMLLLSIATGLAPLDPDTVLAFYGIDQLRFVRPVFIGDTIHVATEVDEATPRDEQSGVIASKVSIINQNGELLAIGRFRMLVKREPPDARAEPGTVSEPTAAVQP